MATCCEKLHPPSLSSKTSKQFPLFQQHSATPSSPTTNARGCLAYMLLCIFSISPVIMLYHCILLPNWSFSNEHMLIFLNTHGIIIAKHRYLYDTLPLSLVLLQLLHILNSVPALIKLTFPFLKLGFLEVLPWTMGVSRGPKCDFCCIPLEEREMILCWMLFSFLQLHCLCEALAPRKAPYAGLWYTFMNKV